MACRAGYLCGLFGWLVVRTGGGRGGLWCRWEIVSRCFAFVAAFTVLCYSSSLCAVFSASLYYRGLREIWAGLGESGEMVLTFAASLLWSRLLLFVLALVSVRGFGCLCRDALRFYALLLLLALYLLVCCR